jgi:hypothetical protein
MQERGNIAGSLAHGDYFNGLPLDAIDDEIRIYRPEKNGIRRKIVASVSHTGIERKSVEGIEEFPIQRSAASTLSWAIYSQISSRSRSAALLRT